MKPWIVRKTGFAERLSSEEMAIFMRVCPDKRYRKGETIFYAGDPATDLHVVAGGQIKLTVQTPSGSERILAVCGEGDFIGEAFLSEAARYHADAVALTDAVTCPVSRAQFLQLSLQLPNFVLTFSEILAGNLWQCHKQLGLSYAPVKERLVQVLLEQAARFGEADEEGWVRLKTSLKHEELAAMISATRVSVSMAMAEMRDEGLVEGTRGDYRLNAAVLAAQLRA
jgi:CRP/FNR family cyclic AMP-dependent transcriptional regulator